MDIEGVRLGLRCGEDESDPPRPPSNAAMQLILLRQGRGGLQEYEYQNSASTCHCAYVFREVGALCGDLGPGTRVLDVGCGNGALAGYFLNRGCSVVGVDLSRTTHLLLAAKDAGVRWFFLLIGVRLQRREATITGCAAAERARRLSGDAGGMLRSGEA